MEGSVYMWTCLVFIPGAHSIIYFGQEGETIPLLLLHWGSEVDRSVLYRIHEDGDLLLVNCSQPHIPQLDGNNVTCFSKLLLLSLASVSQTGHYRVDGWRLGTVTHSKRFQLIVCTQELPQPLNILQRSPALESSERAYAKSVELCRMNVVLDNITALKVYRNGRTGRGFLVMDSSSSLEPLVEDLKGKLQLDLNSSRVTLRGMSGDRFYCTIWRKAQCLTYSRAQGKRIEHVFTSEGKNVTLPCISKAIAHNGTYKATVHWTTPTKELIHQEVAGPQEVVYMLNGSQNGNYSLIIPTVTKQQSGWYSCRKTMIWYFTSPLTTIALSVCPQSLPLDVMFSHGESVSMPLTLNNTHDTQSQVYWYRKKDQQSEEDLLFFSINSLWSEEDLLYASEGFGPVQIPEQLRGRVNMNRKNTLTISNLTAGDSAVFTWRRFSVDDQAWRCTEGRIRLVYRDPFGAGSPFYRVYGSVLGTVLLGLVAAVVWVIMRNRKGEPTSGPQSREEQQSGDEHLYDIVAESSV